MIDRSEMAEAVSSTIRIFSGDSRVRVVPDDEPEERRPESLWQGMTLTFSDEGGPVTVRFWLIFMDRSERMIMSFALDFPREPLIPEAFLMWSEIANRLAETLYSIQKQCQEMEHSKWSCQSN